MLAQQYHRLTLNHKHVTRVVGTTFGLAWSRREARETQLQQENCETAAPLHARLRCGKRGELTVTELADAVGTSQQAVSNQRPRLVDRRIRVARRNGKHVHYLWGAQTRSCSSPVLMEETAEQVTSEHRAVLTLTGVRSTSIPSAARTASNAAVHFVSRSRTRNRNRPTRSLRPLSRLRACCVTDSPTGCAVTPSTWTWRVATSITNSTYSRLRNTVSTVKKSTASTPLACARRNCRQVIADRVGAGSTPAPRRAVLRLVSPRHVGARPRPKIKSPRPAPRTQSPTAGSLARQPPVRNGPVERSVRRHDQR